MRHYKSREEEIDPVYFRTIHVYVFGKKPVPFDGQNIGGVMKNIIATVLLSMFILAITSAVGPAFAMHPELVIPEKVASSNKACQEIMRLGEKYQAEGLFSKEFTDGQCQIDRLDVAVAVQILTEKMAEKVANEGAGAIDREDLVILSNLKEELRGEMLLAQSRAFQSRYSSLGTNLHALTKNITLSGGMVGVLQGSFNNEPRNHTDVVGRGDLVFSFKIANSTIAVIDLEATGGNGLDEKIANFSLLNGVAGSTDDRARFREAWVEHSAFNDRLFMTIGKIDLTNYFDANSVANDENSQFLGGALVNSTVLGAPGNGPGIRINGQLSDSLILGLGYGSGDSDTSDIFDHGFGMAEVDYRLRLGELEGNYRVYATLDGTEADGEMKVKEKNAFGIGLSIDQQFTDKLTLFGRFGWRDENTYVTKSAWSAGLQYAGFIADRKDDLIAFGYGQVLADSGNASRAGLSVTGQEKFMEAYYKAQINEQIAVSPHFQYLINPQGDKGRDNVFVMGVRTQITF
jgi:high affinity Mn2+ porin